MSSPYPTLDFFHYSSGRLGFLLKDGKKRIALTNDLEQIKDKKSVIFRTYGESEEYAISLAKKFLDTEEWTRVGTVVIGENKALILMPNKDFHNQIINNKKIK